MTGCLGIVHCRLLFTVHIAMEISIHSSGMALFAYRLNIPALAQTHPCRINIRTKSNLFPSRFLHRNPSYLISHSSQVKGSIPSLNITWKPKCFSSHDRYAKDSKVSEKPNSSKFGINNSPFKAVTLALPLSRTFESIKPFVESQRESILKAWLCAVISVGSLFLAVPCIGELSGLLAAGDLRNLTKKAVFTMALVLSRSVARYFQQALLWEVALNVTYEIRSYVFQRVLNRHLSYFEGAGVTLTGDIAYRITAEGKDTADTVYALLHTVVPSALQLIAMGLRMFFLSPILSLATISVIPCMSFVIAYFGEKLRKISRKAQESIAVLSSYLNEVLPSMIIVKAYNAEDCEHHRFEKLANADRNAHISKKKLKAFIPEVITSVYAGTTLILFWVGSWVISCGTFNGSGMVSFVTSLVLLIEPIQEIHLGVGEVSNRSTHS